MGTQGSRTRRVCGAAGKQQPVVGSIPAPDGTQGHHHAAQVGLQFLDPILAVALGANGCAAEVQSNDGIIAQNLIKSYVIAAITLGLLPFPIVDLATLMGLQLKLVHALARHYSVPFKESTGKALISSLLSGTTSIVSVASLCSLAKSVPPLGTLGGGASVAITAGAATYAVGRVFAAHFESGGRLPNFRPEKIQTAFNQELEKGGKVVQSLRE